MTLNILKTRIKQIGLITVVSVYGLGAFLLGRISSVDNFLNIKHTNTNEVVRPIDTSIPYADIQSGAVISSFAKLCSNTVYSYQLVYPKDWFTTFNTEPQKCSFFAPFSFIVPQDIDSPFVPISIEVTNSEDWLQNSKFYQNPNEFQNVISVENIQINDKSVQKIRAQTTGDGFLPRGFIIVRYLIQANQNSLVLSYQQLNEKDDTKMYEDSLSEMASSLIFY